VRTGSEEAAHGNSPFDVAVEMNGIKDVGAWWVEAGWDLGARF
jgi:hypothetical protein